LPDLDVNNVSQFTFDELVLNEIGISSNKIESKNEILKKVLAGSIDEKIISFKSSILFLKMLEKYIDEYINSNFDNDILYEGIKICDATDVKKYLKKQCLVMIKIIRMYQIFLLNY